MATDTAGLLATDMTQQGYVAINTEGLHCDRHSRFTLRQTQQIYLATVTNTADLRGHSHKHSRFTWPQSQIQQVYVATVTNTAGLRGHSRKHSRFIGRGHSHKHSRFTWPQSRTQQPIYVATVTNTAGLRGHSHKHSRFT